MANETSTNLSADKIRRWLRNLDRFDPERLTLEAMRRGDAAPH